MKGLILSGGSGTRLRPLTHTCAKQLVPIANKPVLFYGIEALTAADILDIGVIVSPAAAPDIAAVAGDGSRFGASLTYIVQEKPLGLAHAVLTARDYLGSEPFVVYLGDNILRNGIQELVHAFQITRPDSLILLTPVEHPEQYGVAELDSGRVIRLLEKPTQPDTNLALVGVYMFGPAIFDAASAIRPSARGELEITDALQHLIDRGYRVDSQLVHGWWKDTGRVDDILEANRLVLDDLAASVDGEIVDSDLGGRINVAQGTSIVRSVIRGPTSIGSRSTIKDSYIGPFTSIGDEVEITRSEVEASIILSGSSLVGVGRRIDRSLIGRDVSILSPDLPPATYRFVVGDQSTVTVP